MESRVSTVKRLIVVAVLIFGIAWAGAPLRERLRQGAELQQLQAGAKQVRRSNHELRGRITALKGDDAYLELVARRRLGLIKPGEEAFAVITSKDSSRHDAADAKTVNEKKR